MPVRREKPTNEGQQTEELVPIEVRRRVLSGNRVRVAFVVLALGLLALLSAMTVLGVGQIFDWLTPIAERDLVWKTQRSVAELARTADLAIVLEDEGMIRA